MTDIKDLTGTVTVNEAAEALTGYEEIGIRDVFEREFEDLSHLGMLRALFFVMKRREGHGHQAARSFAMEAPAKTVRDYFLDEPADPTQG